MPHSHTLTARVSAAWTISSPLGHRAGVGARTAGSGTIHRLLLVLVNDLSAHFDPTFFVFIDFWYTFKYRHRKITEQRR